jgi:hypothetical protein
MLLTSTKENTMKSIFQRKEDAFLLVAFASLKHWGEPTSKENLSAEKARLERVAESFYLDVEQEYNQFLLEWLKTNAREIVYGNEFTYDPVIPDESIGFNLNSYVEKEAKRNAKRAAV